ncbi:DUF368 domain-containing protein [Evansella sp. LMS18]|uniref:DUF368 domain-containing protein n=1 Tax=Evansella sp. LMS18 TaxID=2924033 RepID=UPI0020D093A5|nr:DUF368 domain-containing protein [Evansella sp. LMS18]UTR09264.1 DUF368 domain-containing protein [Evansella sp. LMS18]
MEWRNLYRGAMMGTSDLIPGVSGGTIAVLLGIYDQFIGAISGIFSKDWKRHLLFLIPLGMGMVLAIFSLSNLIEWLLTYHFEPTQFFFLGLIIGIIPLLVRNARLKETFTVKHYAALIAAALLVGSMGLLPAEESSALIELTSFSAAAGLFFSGWLASMSMLLPGISGSFVLLLLGVYRTAINALATLNFPVILTIGAGVAIGFIVSSKLIKFLLQNYPVMVYAVIIGLVAGSTVVVYPGITSMAALFPSIITFIGGAATALLLGGKN